MRELTAFIDIRTLVFKSVPNAFAISHCIFRSDVTNLFSLMQMQNEDGHLLPRNRMKWLSELSSEILQSGEHWDACILVRS